MTDLDRMRRKREDLLLEIEIQKKVLMRFLQADRKEERFDPHLLESAKAAVIALDNARRKVAQIEFDMFDGNVPTPIRNCVTNGHVRRQMATKVGAV
jgi:hypothetical protein